MELMHVTEAIRLCGLSDMEYVPEIALERGNAVHAAIALDCGLRPDGTIAAESQLDEASVDPVHVAPRLASFRRWRACANPRIIACERAVSYPAMAYCGRLDLVVQVSLGADTIIDVKNGAAANWHPYQTALYALAWVAEHGGATPARGCLYLDSQGGPAKWIKHTDRRDCERAKAIITVAYMRKEGGA